jgi:hypothetical protein
MSYLETLSKVMFIQINLTKMSYLGTLSKVMFIQINLTKMSYLGTLVMFIQVFGLFSVCYTLFTMV